MNTTFFRNLLREPALLLDLAETLLVALVAFGLPVSGDQQTYIVAALVALVGLVKAFAVRPFAVPAITDFGRAALALVASFGVGLTADQIAILVTLLGTITTVIVRAQVTPRNDPVIKVGGAGAGPVAGEAGYAAGGSVLGMLGVLLIVLAVVLLFLFLLHVVAVGWVPILVLFLVGMVLLFLGGRPAF